MSRRYINFGAGWFKQKKDGEEYLSCTVGNRKDPVELVLKTADGEEIPVTSFAAFLNKNKKADTHPDFSFTVTVE